MPRPKKHKARGSYDDTGYDFWCDEDEPCDYHTSFVNGQAHREPGDPDTYHVLGPGVQPERRDDRLKTFKSV